MEQIEEIKKILRDNYKTDNTDLLESVCETEEEFTDRVAHQISQLFPQGDDEGLIKATPENPWSSACLKAAKAQRDLTRQKIPVKAEGEGMAQFFKSKLVKDEDRDPY